MPPILPARLRPENFKDYRCDPQRVERVAPVSSEVASISAGRQAALTRRTKRSSKAHEVRTASGGGRPYTTNVPFVWGVVACGVRSGPVGQARSPHRLTWRSCPQWEDILSRISPIPCTLQSIAYRQ